LRRQFRPACSGVDLAKFQDFGQTAESMGREDPDVLYKNYREAIKEQGTLMSSGNWFSVRGWGEFLTFNRDYGNRSLTVQCISSELGSHAYLIENPKGFLAEIAWSTKVKHH
jgi:hypothetical protein